MVIISTNSPNNLVKELGNFGVFGDEKRVEEFVRRTSIRLAVVRMQCARNWPQSINARQWCA